MKKILSVLLTVTMLLGCFSVGLVSFAAAPADEAAMAQALKDTTTYLTSTTPITVNEGKWNENTYFSYPASYTFSRSVNKTFTKMDDTAVVNAADAYNAGLDAADQSADPYGDFLAAKISDESYITRDDNGTIISVDVARYINDNFKMEEVVSDYITSPVNNTNVDPGKTGINPLGENAIKVIDLDPAEIINYNASTGVFNLADIVLADQDSAIDPATTEESSLAKVIAVFDSEQADAVLATIKSNPAVKDATHFKYAVNNITVSPKFKTTTLTEDRIIGGVSYAAGDTFTTLLGIEISYKISYSANIRFDFSDVEFPYVAEEIVTTSYTNIKEVLAVVTAAELIDLVNAETAYAVDASATDAHVTSSYDFNKTVVVADAMHSNASSSLNPSTVAALSNILRDKYPEYDGYINTNPESSFNGEYYDDDASRYTFDDIIMNRLALDKMGDIVYDGTDYTVGKGVDGTEVLGDDALKAMTIDAGKINSYTYSASSNYLTLKFNDEEFFPGTGETVIDEIYDNGISASVIDEIVADFADLTKGSSIDNLNIVFSNITLNVAFESVNGQLQIKSINFVYDINYSADLYLADSVGCDTVSGVYKSVINYNNIERFNPETDIDPAIFVDVLNQASEFATYEKAGYDYERNASFVGEPIVDISGSTVGTVTGVLDMIAGLLGSSVTGVANDTLKDYLLSDMDVTDFSASVPVTENAVDYLGENYALKEIALEANDIDTIKYDAEKNAIVFTFRDEVNPEKDEMSALSRFTNDFTAASELRNKLAIQIADSFGISFISEDEPCDVTYTNIKGYVSFAGADADNIYGDGTIDTLGMSYDCNLNATFSGVVLSADETMKSVYTNFTYCDYEMGDVDMSSRVSVVDAKLVLKTIVNLHELEGKNFELADMNYDGKISVIDAKKILEKIVNK